MKEIPSLPKFEAFKNETKMLVFALHTYGVGKIELSQPMSESESKTYMRILRVHFDSENMLEMQYTEIASKKEITYADDIVDRFDAIKPDLIFRFETLITALTKWFDTLYIADCPCGVVMSLDSTAVYLGAVVDIDDPSKILGIQYTGPKKNVRTKKEDRADTHSLFRQFFGGVFHGATVDQIGAVCGMCYSIINESMDHAR